MNLASDLTRLRDEMGALRKDRGTFMNELRIAVADMRAGFCGAHMEMARKMKADLRAFMHSFRQKVAEQREEVRGELAAAHRAWFGRALVSEQRRTAEAPRKPHKK